MQPEKIVVNYTNKCGQLMCSAKLLSLVRNNFSVANPNYKSRRFYPRLYIITPSGAFQIGLWGEIESFLNSLKIPLKITLTPEFEKHYKPVLSFSKISNIENYTYYDYQQKSLECYIEHGRGIVLLATGAGKTLLIAGMCQTILDHEPTAKILIIVPDVGLLNQTYYDMTEKFNISCIERWGDKKIPEWNKNIIISNTQMLTYNIPLSIKKLHNYDYVIVDEVHRLGEKNNEINKVIHNITTVHKFGMTGTLPDNMMSAWNSIGRIGPILYMKSSHEIRQTGNISEVEVMAIELTHNTFPDEPEEEDLDKPTAKYEKELEFIARHPERNKLIIDIAEKLTGNTLILVDRREYGELLLKEAVRVDKTTVFINGDTDTDIREDIKKQLEETDGHICIAMTRVFSTGISVNNLHNVIFAYIGKSNVKIIQSIGRSLRRHSTKSKAKIFDISDNFRYSYDHYRDRLRIYDDEKIPYVRKKLVLK